MEFKPYQPIIITGLLNLSNDNRYDAYGIFMKYNKDGMCLVQVNGVLITMAIGRIKAYEIK